jgi:hypothetical protein
VSGAVEVRQFHGGASNPTFLVTAGPADTGALRRDWYRYRSTKDC